MFQVAEHSRESRHPLYLSLGHPAVSFQLVLVLTLILFPSTDTSVTNCGGELVASLVAGNLTSPGYSSPGYYSAYSKCTWHITVRERNWIIVDYLFFYNICYCFETSSIDRDYRCSWEMFLATIVQTIFGLTWTWGGCDWGFSILFDLSWDDRSDSQNSLINSHLRFFAIVGVVQPPSSYRSANREPSPDPVTQRYAGKAFAHYNSGIYNNYYVNMYVIRTLLWIILIIYSL